MMLRLATRANVRLILEIIQATRRCLGGDLESSLIFAAVSAANVGQVEDDPRLARLYADKPVPDDLRRPIRVQRLAESLELPRETTRMKVHQLLTQGCLVDTADGLLMSEAPLRSPQFQAMFGAYMVALDETVERLAVSGACGLDRGERLARPPFPTMWSAIRQVTQHALRGVVILRHQVRPSNLFQSYLVMAMAHRTDWAPGAPRPGAAGDNAQDDLLSSASALAAFTGYPRETVRRNLKILTQRGWLIQEQGGFSLASPRNAPESEREREVQRRSSADLVRLIRKLRHVNAIEVRPANPGPPETAR